MAVAKKNQVELLDDNWYEIFNQCPFTEFRIILITCKKWYSIIKNIINGKIMGVPHPMKREEEDGFIKIMNNTIEFTESETLYDKLKFLIIHDKFSDVISKVGYTRRTFDSTIISKLFGSCVEENIIGLFNFIFDSKSSGLCTFFTNQLDAKKLYEIIACVVQNIYTNHLICSGSSIRSIIDLIKSGSINPHTSPKTCYVYNINVRIHVEEHELIELINLHHKDNSIKIIFNSHYHVSNRVIDINYISIENLNYIGNINEKFLKQFISYLLRNRYLFIKG